MNGGGDYSRGSFRRNIFVRNGGTGQMLSQQTVDSISSFKTSTTEIQQTGLGGTDQISTIDETSVADGAPCPPVEEVFRDVKWQPAATLTFKRANVYLLSLLRLVIYCFLFVTVVIGLISTKVGLLIATRGLSDDKEDKTTIPRQTLLLLSIFLVPDVFQFAKSILHRKELPPKKTMILEILKEVINTVISFLFVFKVTPRLNGFELAIFVMGTCLIPALLKLISYIRDACTKKTDKIKCTAIVRMIGNIALLSAMVIPMLYVANCFFDYPSVSWSFITKKTYEPEVLTFGLLCLIFLSVRWLENYLPKNISELEWLPSVLQWKSPEKHHTLSLVTSMIRIATALALFHFIPDGGIPAAVSSLSSDVCSTANITRDAWSSSYNCSNCTTLDQSFLSGLFFNCTLNWEILGPILVMFLSALLVYHAAVVACQLCMQRFAFTLAIFLSEITFVLLFITPSGSLFFKWTGFGINLEDSSYNHELKVFLTPVFFAGMFALFTTTVHVLKSQMSRMAQVGSRRRIARDDKAMRDRADRNVGDRADRNGTPARDEEAMRDGTDRNVRDRTDRNGTPARDDEAMRDRTDRNGTPQQKLIACATLWQESEEEMTSLISSLFRLEKALVKDKTKKKNYKQDIDTYEFEARIYFDNAFVTKNDGNERVWNEHVHRLVDLIPQAACKGVGRRFNLHPKRLKMPFGERLKYRMLCGSSLVIELKDKLEIKIKKRWSQIMYMLYLLHYKLCGDITPNRENTQGRNAKPFSHLPEEIVSKANNTFILTLDGDVDFQPDAVITLLDTIKRDDQIGSVCGRLKPVGNGLLVWYQKFEYAIGHWLQKSTEHITGSVLCSPGCFSLFRAKALMDDNVLSQYKKIAKEPQDCLKYDQGEDRWLSTLLLLQGWRIVYAASSYAKTCCPETFTEFFKQRRRWITSTMANIIALVKRWPELVNKNKNIGHCYMLYTSLLFVSSVLGPSTVLLAIESAIDAVFNIPTWLSVLLSFSPTIFYIILCIKGSQKAQITWAFICSSLYGLLMLAVIVGTLVNILEEGWFAPNALFLAGLTLIYVTSGLLHPGEWLDLFCGIIYFLCIPTGYLFLIIFAVCNCHSLEWGTRSNESSDERRENPQQYVKCFSALFDLIKNSNAYLRGRNESDRCDTTGTKTKDPGVNVSSVTMKLSNAVDRKEQQYWEAILTTVLKPDDEQQCTVNSASRIESNNPGVSTPPTSTATPSRNYSQDMMKVKMQKLRRVACLVFFLLNAIWLVVMLSFKQVQNSVFILLPNSNNSGVPLKIQPLNLMFLALFAILLFVQLIAMLCHRYYTFLYVISKTRVWPDTSHMKKDTKFDEDFEMFLGTNLTGTATRPPTTYTSERSTFETRFERWYQTFRGTTDNQNTARIAVPGRRIPRHFASLLRHFHQDNV